MIRLMSNYSSSSSQHPIPDCACSYFAHFEGHQDCGLTSSTLYEPPRKDKHHHKLQTPPYCRNRATLLEALSGGGRHGFDAPFFPAGCHYRWYTTAEICMILDRFDAIVFMGDGMLQHIYAAFNMLLRENIAWGGLKQWNLKDGERDSCRCDNQIIKGECASQTVTSSSEVREYDGSGSHRSPYYCDRKLLSVRYSILASLAYHLRHPPYFPLHQQLSSAHQPPLDSHEHPGQKPRLVQTHPNHPLALPQYLPLLAARHIFHGRMACDC